MLCGGAIDFQEIKKLWVMSHMRKGKRKISRKCLVISPYLTIVRYIIVATRFILLAFCLARTAAILLSLNSFVIESSWITLDLHYYVLIFVYIPSIILYKYCIYHSIFTIYVLSVHQYHYGLCFHIDIIQFYLYLIIHVIRFKHVCNS